MQHTVSAFKKLRKCILTYFELYPSCPSAQTITSPLLLKLLKSKSKLEQIGLASCERLVGVDVASLPPKRRDLS